MFLLVAFSVALFSLSEAAPQVGGTNCACTGVAAGCPEEGWSCYVGSDWLAAGRDRCTPGACASPRQCKCNYASDDGTTFCAPFFWRGTVPICTPDPESAVPSNQVA